MRSNPNTSSTFYTMSCTAKSSLSVMLENNVFLFIPNLIGYARVVLVGTSCYFMPFDPVKAVILYLLSVILDEFDGQAARAFNQCTKFGAVFDMVTDRCSNACLVMFLCYVFPSWIFVFQVIVALEISSHWIQVYSSMLHGKTTHKTTDLSAHPIMRFYYTEPVLITLILFNELFFLALYLNHFYSDMHVTLFGLSVGLWKLLAIICFPVSFLKHVIGAIAFVVCCMNIRALDAVDYRSR